MKTFITLILASIFIVSCGKPNSGGSANIIDSAMIAALDKKWEKAQTLNITFVDGTPEQKAEVELFSKEWTKYANINFNFYPSRNAIPRNKDVDILITFSGQGNDSNIGTDSRYNIIQKKTPSMSLSNLDAKNIHFRRFIILHEFGHALGLQHEHQHIDRKFTLDPAKTLEYCQKVFAMDEETCKIQVVATIPKTVNTRFLKYDPLSIMHYSFHEGFFDGKASIKQNMNLSLLDKIEIAALYPGRMKKEKIIEQHKFDETAVENLKTYKNCKIDEILQDANRFDETGKIVTIREKRYSLSSLMEGEYKSKFIWENKEEVILLMKNDEYCNYEASEIEALRARAVTDQKEKQRYGRCIIPLNDDGSPIPGTCAETGMLYRITEFSSDEFVVRSCYQSFEAALAVQLQTDYCKKTVEEVDPSKSAQPVKIENVKKEKCSIKRYSEIKNSACRESNPWQVTKNGKNISKLCYADLKKAHSAMDSAKVCK